MCRREDGSELYNGSPLILPEHDRILKVNVGRAIKERPTLYDAVRWAWPLPKNTDNETLLRTIAYVVACVNRRVVGVFKPTLWYQVTKENAKVPEDVGRWAFEGEEAEPEVLRRYLNRMTPHNQGHVYFRPPNVK